MISVIIVNYNGAKYIKDCIKSLQSSIYKNFEIIFVDDCSTDQSFKIIKKFKNVKLIQNKKNLGASLSRNKGAKRAKGNLLFFLDVDTKTIPSALDNLAKEFNKNETMGAAQVQLIKADKNVLDSSGHYLSPFGFPYETGTNKNPDKYQEKRKILGGKSAGLIVRKNVFEKINGFDSDYFIYGEDTDLCWHVWLSGFEVFYLPSVKIFHFQKSSINKNTKKRVFYQGTKNNLNYLLKNLELKKFFWIIPLHVLGWMLLFFKKVLTGEFKFALAIINGLFWNLINLPKIMQKRGIIKSKNIDRKILFGEIKIGSLFNKGLRWFKNV